MSEAIPARLVAALNILRSSPVRWRGASPSTRRTVVSSILSLLMLVVGLTVITPMGAFAANHTIVIKDFSFTPATLNIAPGDTITFVNQETDNVVHNIRGAFTSPDLAPGASFTVTVSAAGTYNYNCGLHTFMTGQIFAGTATSPAPTTSSPRPSPTPTRTTGPSTTPSATPTVSPTGSATPSSSASPTPPGTQPCANPTVGADQGDGTRLATFTVAADGYKVFALCMAPIQWEISPGVVRSALAFNGIIPGPTIKVTENDKVRVIVQNNLTEHTGLHWHGMILPNAQDGVPGLTQEPIEPGAIYTYEWTAKATGTHWYHTHMGGSQVGKGLYGGLLVTPLLGDIAADKHYTVAVSDGLGFTFNGKSWPSTVPLVAKVGQRVHLRIIGAGPEGIHSIHLHGQPFQVIAQDGNKLPSPYSADTILVGPGQTYDLMFQPVNPGRWLLHCHIFSHAEGEHGMNGMTATVDVSP